MVETLSSPVQSIPRALQQPYRGERYIARAPFLINDTVDDARIKGRLAKVVVHEDQMFVGIAGMRALDLLATIGKKTGQQYQEAVLLDHNTTQIKAMHAIFQLVKEAPDAGSFIDAFARHHALWVNQVPRVSRVNPPREDHRTSEDWNYFAVHGNKIYPRTEQEVREQLTDTMMNDRSSWLHPGNFPRIKQMIEDDCIHTAIVDLTDKKRVEQLVNWISRERGMRVGHFYISSLEIFADHDKVYDYYGRSNTQEHRNAFFNNVRLLLTTGNDMQDAAPARLLHSEFKLGAGAHYFTLRMDGVERVEAYLRDSGHNGGPLYEKPFAVGDRAMMLNSYARVAGYGRNGQIVLSVTPQAPLVEPRRALSFTKAEQHALLDAMKEVGLPVNVTRPEEPDTYVVIVVPLPFPNLEKAIDRFVALAQEKLRPLQRLRRYRSPSGYGPAL